MLTIDNFVSLDSPFYKYYDTGGTAMVSLYEWCSF